VNICIDADKDFSVPTTITIKQVSYIFSSCILLLSSTSFKLFFALKLAMSIQTSRKEFEERAQMKLFDAAHKSKHQKIKIDDEADKQYSTELKLVLIVVTVVTSMFLVALICRFLSFVPLDSSSDRCRIELSSQQLYRASPANSAL
jgi:hypothetical protein